LTWHDMMLRLTGPVVLQLQGIFVEDWYHETTERIEQPEYFPKQEPSGDLVIQSLPSGPSFSTENYQRLVVAALYGAKEQVTITSPYLVPDEPLLQALQVCALRGVRVNLIVPRKGDQRLPDLACRAYFDD